MNPNIQHLFPQAYNYVRDYDYRPQAANTVKKAMSGCKNEESTERILVGLFLLDEPLQMQDFMFFSSVTSIPNQPNAKKAATLLFDIGLRLFIRFAHRIKTVLRDIIRGDMAMPSFVDVIPSIFRFFTLYDTKYFQRHLVVLESVLNTFLDFVSELYKPRTPQAMQETAYGCVESLILVGKKEALLIPEEPGLIFNFIIDLLGLLPTLKIAQEEEPKILRFIGVIFTSILEEQTPQPQINKDQLKEMSSISVRLLHDIINFKGCSDDEIYNAGLRCIDMYANTSQTSDELDIEKQFECIYEFVLWLIKICPIDQATKEINTIPGPPKKLGKLDLKHYFKNSKKLTNDSIKLSDNLAEVTHRLLDSIKNLQMDLKTHFVHKFIDKLQSYELKRTEDFFRLYITFMMNLLSKIDTELLGASVGLEWYVFLSEEIFDPDLTTPNDVALKSTVLNTISNVFKLAPSSRDSILMAVDLYIGRNEEAGWFYFKPFLISLLENDAQTSFTFSLFNSSLFDTLIKLSDGENKSIALFIFDFLRHCVVSDASSAFQKEKPTNWCISILEKSPSTAVSIISSCLYADQQTSPSGIINYIDRTFEYLLNPYQPLVVTCMEGITSCFLKWARSHKYKNTRKQFLETGRINYFFKAFDQNPTDELFVIIIKDLQDILGSHRSCLDYLTNNKEFCRLFMNLKVDTLDPTDYLLQITVLNRPVHLVLFPLAIELLFKLTWETSFFPSVVQRLAGLLEEYFENAPLVTKVFGFSKFLDTYHQIEDKALKQQMFKVIELLLRNDFTDDNVKSLVDCITNNKPEGMMLVLNHLFEQTEAFHVPYYFLFDGYQTRLQVRKFEINQTLDVSFMFRPLFTSSMMTLLKITTKTSKFVLGVSKTNFKITIGENSNTYSYTVEGNKWHEVKVSIRPEISVEINHAKVGVGELGSFLPEGGSIQFGSERSDESLFGSLSFISLESGTLETLTVNNINDKTFFVGTVIPEAKTIFKIIDDPVITLATTDSLKTLPDHIHMLPSLLPDLINFFIHSFKVKSASVETWICGNGFQIFSDFLRRCNQEDLPEDLYTQLAGLLDVIEKDETILSMLKWIWFDFEYISGLIEELQQNFLKAVESKRERFITIFPKYTQAEIVFTKAAQCLPFERAEWKQFFIPLLQTSYQKDFFNFLLNQLLFHLEDLLGDYLMELFNQLLSKGHQQFFETLDDNHIYFPFIRAFVRRHKSSIDPMLVKTFSLLKELQLRQQFAHQSITLETVFWIINVFAQTTEDASVLNSSVSNALGIDNGKVKDPNFFVLLDCVHLFLSLEDRIKQRVTLFTLLNEDRDSSGLFIHLKNWYLWLFHYTEEAIDESDSLCQVIQEPFNRLFHRECSKPFENTCLPQIRSYLRVRLDQEFHQFYSNALIYALSQGVSDIGPLLREVFYFVLLPEVQTSSDTFEFKSQIFFEKFMHSHQVIIWKRIFALRMKDFDWTDKAIIKSLLPNMTNAQLFTFDIIPKVQVKSFEAIAYIYSLCERFDGNAATQDELKFLKHLTTFMVEDDVTTYQSAAILSKFQKFKDNSDLASLMYQFEDLMDSAENRIFVFEDLFASNVKEIGDALEREISEHFNQLTVYFVRALFITPAKFSEQFQNQKLNLDTFLDKLSECWK